jgi:hypothetical protein
MNDIKEKEQLPIVPLATLLLSCERGQKDRQTKTISISPCRLLAGDKQKIKEKIPF